MLPREVEGVKCFEQSQGLNTNKNAPLPFRLISLHTLPIGRGLPDSVHDILRAVDRCEATPFYDTVRARLRSI